MREPDYKQVDKRINLIVGYDKRNNKETKDGQRRSFWDDNFLVKMYIMKIT